MAGLPDTDEFGTYGGAVANYIIGVFDPTTDEDAAARNVYVANVAAMTHMVARAIRSFLGPTAGQTMLSDPTAGFSHDAVWGSSPAVRPVGTYVSVGVIDIAWPTMVTDELNVAHTVTLQNAFAAVEAPDGSFAFAKTLMRANNKVRVYTFDASLSAANLVGYTVTVWVR